MSVVFHPLPTSCAPTAQSHPSSAHVPRKPMGLVRLSPLSLSAAAAAASSSSPANFHNFSLRCICHHQAPPGTKPTITAASRRLTSADHPGLPRKAPFFAAQPCRCSSGDDGAPVVTRFARLPASGGTLHDGVPDGATIIWGTSPLRRQQRFTSRLAAAGRPTSSKKEDKLVTEGLITELLPNCMFRVRLDNGEVILGYVSGKMRTKMVRVMVGDRVRIEVSRYDSTRGRIVFRLRSKSSAD